MRAATRLVSALLALALIAGAGLALVEAIGALTAAGPWIVPADRWLRWGRSTSWNDLETQLVLVAFLTAGVALVVHALWPRRLHAVRTSDGGTGVELFIERRSLERALAGRVQRVDGVRDSEARVGKHKVVLDVRATARADGAEDGARHTAATSLEHYGVELTDRITVNLRRRTA